MDHPNWCFEEFCEEDGVHAAWVDVLSGLGVDSVRVHVNQDLITGKLSIDIGTEENSSAGGHFQDGSDWVFALNELKEAHKQLAMLISIVEESDPEKRNHLSWK